MEKFNAKKIKQLTGLNDQEFFEIKKKLIGKNDAKEYLKEELDLFAFSKLYIELGETPLNIINKFKELNNDSDLILKDIHLLASQRIKKSIEVIGIVEAISSIGIGYNDKSIFEYIDFRKIKRYLDKVNLKLMLMLNDKIEAEMSNTFMENIKEKMLDNLTDDDIEFSIENDELQKIESGIKSAYAGILNKDEDPYRMLLLDMLSEMPKTNKVCTNPDIKTAISKYFKQFNDELLQALRSYSIDERDADLIVLTVLKKYEESNIKEINLYNWKDSAPNLIRIISKYYPIFNEKDTLCVLDGIINGIINIGDYEGEYIGICKVIKEIIKYYLNTKEDDK